MSNGEHRDPRKVMRGILKMLRRRIEALPIVGGLVLYVSVGEAAQEAQEAVSSEVLREVRESQTLLNLALADDGQASPRELAPVYRRLREADTELSECRILKGV